jgi:hypothetical protein
MNLRDYLVANQNAMHIQDRVHDSLVEEISRKPSKLGISESAELFINVALTDDYNAQMGDVDIVALDGEEVYLVEVKTRGVSDGPRKMSIQRNAARNQLEQAYKYFKKRFGVLPRMLGYLKYWGSQKAEILRLERPIDDLFNSHRS